MQERNILGVWFDRLLDACAACGCLIIVFQVFSVSLEVMSRELMGISFQWVIPVNEWSLIYLTFLGAAWLQREKGHIGDDSVVTYLPPWVKRTFKVLGVILGLSSCLLLAVYGAQVTWQRYATDAYDYFKLDSVPIYLAYLVIPLGSLLWLIQLLRETIGKLRERAPHSHPRL